MPKQFDPNKKFEKMTVLGQTITDRKLAAEKLMYAIKESGSMLVPIKIANYRNFDIYSEYNVVKNTHVFYAMKNGKHYGEFGESSDGNITRIDNVIDSLPDKLIRLQHNLDDAKQQLEHAKLEVTKEFSQENELKNKTLRLAELNKLLDIGDVEELENPSPTMENVKKAVIDFMNRETQTEYSYDDFDRLFPDLNHVMLAKGNWSNNSHEYAYELDLENFTVTRYFDNMVLIKHDLFADKKMVDEDKKANIVSMLNSLTMKQALDLTSKGVKAALEDRFNINVNDLSETYDPLVNDMDNDGVPDRYDNDFRDSDYFESTYDVEDNLHSKEENDKPSILNKIHQYQAEIKDEDKREHNSLTQKRDDITR